MEKIFLDTNLLCYYFDDNEPQKQTKAQNLIDELVAKKQAAISTQSLQEFSNVAIKKLKFQEDVVEKILDVFSTNFIVHQNSFKTIKSALKIRTSTGFSFYDSLILAAANESSCTILYSEDLNENQTVGKVKIVNPF